MLITLYTGHILSIVFELLSQRIAISNRLGDIEREEAILCQLENLDEYKREALYHLCSPTKIKVFL